MRRRHVGTSQRRPRRSLGVPLTEVLTRLVTENVLAEYQQRSGMGANANSLLSPYWGELAERLGIPAETISNATDLGSG